MYISVGMIASPNLTPFPINLSYSSVIVKLNSSGDEADPCLIPLVIPILLVFLPLIVNFVLPPLYIACILVINFPDTPFRYNSYHILCLRTLSNAFVKSM